MNSHAIFLMSVLILGIINNPFAFSNFEKINLESSNFVDSNPRNYAFAQIEEEEEESEEEESDVEAEVEVEIEAEEEEIEEEEKEIEIEVEIENGQANIKIKIDNEEQEYTLETEAEAEILASIMEITGLTESEIKEIWKLEIETEEEIEDEEELEEETEIEVEVEKGKAKIKIEFEGEKSRFVLKTTDEGEIISAIEEITGLNESQIRAIWEFEVEEEESEDEESEESSAQTARDAELVEKMTEKESETKLEAEKRISELQQQIEQLEQRLQALLEKLETKEYFGPVVGETSSTKSFSISFDGIAASLDNDSTTAEVSGEIFLETLGSLKDTSKFRVTGGEILVGETFYDVVFGKARITSSGQSGEKDSITIIGQIMSDEGDINTIRIFLDSQVPFEGDFGLEPVDVEIMMPQSKISNQWSLSASGQLLSLEATGPSDFSPSQQPLPDADGDGIPDTLEILIGTDQTQPNSNAVIIDALVDGNLDVTSGQIVVVTGTTVSGNVQLDGGILVVTGGTISGNVDSKNGGSVVISDSTVKGNVNGNGASIIIQNSMVENNFDSNDENSATIENSTVNGNLMTNGTGNVKITGTTVDGNLDVKNGINVEVTNNNVDGNLEIQETVTSCTDTGNNVKGNFDGCP